jgi:hypothetical protein
MAEQDGKKYNPNPHWMHPKNGHAKGYRFNYKFFLKMTKKSKISFFELALV